jgi:hypothetical protein
VKGLVWIGYGKFVVDSAKKVGLVPDYVGVGCGSAGFVDSAGRIGLGEGYVGSGKVVVDFAKKLG